MLRRVFLSLGVLAAFAAVSVSSGQTQEWPSRPVTIVVPFGPGAITDQAARLVAQLLQKKLKQPFVVENRPGAGGLIGARQVSAAQPDGYRFLVTSFGVATLELGTKNDFNAVTQLTPLSRLVAQPQALIVPTSIGVNAVGELVAYAKANPEKAFFGVTDFGGVSHVRHAEFGVLTGVKLKPITYQSGAQIITDESQARLMFGFHSIGSAISLINAGMMKVIAYAGDSVATPKAPSMKSGGVDFEWINWTGLFGPPNMPQDLQNKISQAMSEIMRDPEYIALLNSAGSSRDILTPAQFAAQVKHDRENTIRLMEVTGVKPE